MKPLKIAVLGSISKPTTLDAKGGVEVWTALFLSEAIQRGYTFDLYGIPGSIDIPGKIDLIKVFEKGADEIIHSEFLQDKPLRNDEKILIFDSLYARTLTMLKHNEDKYDLIIDSTGSPFFTITADEFVKPMLVIGHFGATKPYVKFMKIFPVSKNLFYTFPSRRIYKRARIIPQNQKFFIPEGINPDIISYENTEKTHLLWFGRIDPNMKKGADIAMKISTHLNIPLDIYTYIESRTYFNKNISPLLTDNIVINTTSPKTEYFKRAKVFVLPLQWEEPFGLVVPESMASGTPVVAYARGAMPELIVDGVTGFLVNASDQKIRGDFIVKQTGIEGLIEATKRIYKMNTKEYEQMRKNCRQHVLDNFTVKKMVNRYEEVFYKILNFNKKFTEHTSIKRNVKVSFESY